VTTGSPTTAWKVEKVRTSHYNKVLIRFENQSIGNFYEAAGDCAADLSVIHPRMLSILGIPIPSSVSHSSVTFPSKEKVWVPCIILPVHFFGLGWHYIVRDL
jgi:hypothetical protein